MVILILLVSGLAEHFEAHMGPECYSAFISTFEKCVLLEHLLQAKEIERKLLPMIREYIPLVMELYKCTINRKTGMGCKFVKYHLVAHLPDDIERNGSCQNTSSGPGESRHKDACK